MRFAIPKQNVLASRLNKNLTGVEMIQNPTEVETGVMPSWNQLFTSAESAFRRAMAQRENASRIGITVQGATVGSVTSAERAQGAPGSWISVSPEFVTGAAEVTCAMRVEDKALRVRVIETERGSGEYKLRDVDAYDVDREGFWHAIEVPADEANDLAAATIQTAVYDISEKLGERS
jgi:hypothetical protein